MFHVKHTAELRPPAGAVWTHSAWEPRAHAPPQGHGVEFEPLRGTRPTRGRRVRGRVQPRDDFVWRAPWQVRNRPEGEVPAAECWASPGDVARGRVEDGPAETLGRRPSRGSGRQGRRPSEKGDRGVEAGQVVRQSRSRRRIGRGGPGVGGGGRDAGGSGRERAAKVPAGNGRWRGGRGGGGEGRRATVEERPEGVEGVGGRGSGRRR